MEINLAPTINSLRKRENVVKMFFYNILIEYLSFCEMRRYTFMRHLIYEVGDGSYGEQSCI